MISGTNTENKTKLTSCAAQFAHKILQVNVSANVKYHLTWIRTCVFFKRSLYILQHSAYFSNLYNWNRQHESVAVIQSSKKNNLINGGQNDIPHPSHLISLIVRSTYHCSRL